MSIILLPYKITAMALWLLLTYCGYWDQPGKMLLFGFVFGIGIWTGGFKLHPGETPRGTVIIFSTSAAIYAGLTLGLHLTDHPWLSTILMIGFTTTVILGRCKTYALQHEPRENARPTGTCDPVDE